MRFVLVLAALVLPSLASLAAPAPPSNVTATRLNVNSVQVKWRDNSTNEVRFDIYTYQNGLGPFIVVTNLPASPGSGTTNSFNCAGLIPPGFTYQFYVRAFITNVSFSDSPNTTNVVMPPFNPANNLIATNITGESVTLRWSTNANPYVSYYQIAQAVGTGGYSLAGEVLPGVTNFTATASPATSNRFFIRAVFEDALSYFQADSVTVTSVTRNAFTSRKFHPAVVGSAIATYTAVATTNLGAPTNYSAANLPPGLSFNPGNRQITGTPTTAGVFNSSLIASYGGTGSITNTLTFRVIHPNGPPVITATLTNRTFTNTSPATNINLNAFFLDRDTERAVRVVTTKGTADVALYPTATPQTVSNFLGYVTRGDYHNAIFHRAAVIGFGEDFVVQGGGFKPGLGNPITNLTSIPTTPSPTNEPGIQHVRGTLAMAKVGNNPNSATDQWFVNMRDNSSVLDDQNGGFAAFGRVCGAGMSVFDAIMQLPRGNYSVDIDGSTGSFEDWPLDLTPPAPGEIDYNALVLMSSVTPIEPLSYSVTGNTLPAVVSAVVNGTNLTLTPLNSFGGTAAITVTATDLDGNTVAQSFNVTVNTPYTAWLTQFGLNGGNTASSADPENDGLVNGVEFALMGNPNTGDATNVRPTNSFTNISAQNYFMQTFRLRKNLSGATATLRGSSALPGNWTNLWSSSDVGNPLVLQQTDLGDHWLLRVRDALPVPATNTGRFLELRITTPQ